MKCNFYHEEIWIFRTYIHCWRRNTEVHLYLHCHRFVYHGVLPHLPGTSTSRLNRPCWLSPFQLPVWTYALPIVLLVCPPLTLWSLDCSHRCSCCFELRVEAAQLVHLSAVCLIFSLVRNSLFIIEFILYGLILTLLFIISYLSV